MLPDNMQRLTEADVSEIPAFTWPYSALLQEVLLHASKSLQINIVFRHFHYSGHFHIILDLVHNVQDIFFDVSI